MIIKIVTINILRKKSLYLPQILICKLILLHSIINNWSIQKNGKNV